MVAVPDTQQPASIRAGRERHSHVHGISKDWRGHNRARGALAWQQHKDLGPRGRGTVFCALIGTLGLVVVISTREGRLAIVARAAIGRAVGAALPRLSTGRRAATLV